MPTLKVAIDARDAQAGAAAFNASVLAMGNTAKGAGRAVNKLGKNTDKLGKAAQTSAVGLFAAQAAMAALAATRTQLAAAVKTVADFEEIMATVGGVTRATQSDIDALTAAAREMGATTRFSATQAGEGLLFLARAGFSAQEAITALPDTLALASAGAVSLGFAADTASNVLAQFGLKADSTARVVDTLITTSNRANTDVRGLADALKFAGPVAGALGQSVESTAAAIGALGNAGIAGGQAGTNLRGIFAALLKPTTEAKRAIKALGLSLDALNPATNQFNTILARLQRGGLSAGLAVQIFGRRNAAAAIVLANSAKEVKKLTISNEESAGSAKRLAQTIDNTLAGSLRSLKSAFEALVLSAGDAGAGKALKDFVDIATGVIRVLAGMGDSVTENRGLIIALAAAVKGLSAAFATLLALKIIVFLSELTQGLLAASAAGATLTAVLAANPFGAAALAISLLTGGIVALTVAFQDDSVAARRNAAAVRSLAKESDLLANAQRRANNARLEANKIDEAVQLREQAKAIAKIRDELDKLQKAGQSTLDLGVFNRGSTGVVASGGRLLGDVKSVKEAQAKVQAGLAEARNKFLRRGFDNVPFGGALAQTGTEPAFQAQLQGQTFVIRGLARIDELRSKLLDKQKALTVQAVALEAASKAETDVVQAAAQAKADAATFQLKLIDDQAKAQGALNQLESGATDAQQRRLALLQEAAAIAERRFPLDKEAQKAFVDSAKEQLDLAQKLRDLTAQRVLDKQSLLAAQRAEAQAAKEQVQAEQAQFEIAKREAAQANVDTVRNARTTQTSASGGGGASVQGQTASASQPAGTLTAGDIQGLIFALGTIANASDVAARSISSSFENAARSIDRAAGGITNSLSRVGRELQRAFSKLVGNAAGDVVSGGRVQRFASGTILSAPTTFPLASGNTGLAGEAGPEGILPLSRDKFGRLGVTANDTAGAASNGPSVVVNMTVVTQDSSSFRRSQRQIINSLQQQIERT